MTEICVGGGFGGGKESGADKGGVGDGGGGGVGDDGDGGGVPLPPSAIALFQLPNEGDEGLGALPSAQAAFLARERFARWQLEIGVQKPASVIMALKQAQTG